MNSWIQKWLDNFYWLRKRIVTRIVFLSLRLYGSEITWNQIWNENFVSAKHTNRNLNNAGDLDLILEEAKGSLQNAQERREGVTDKCKTLLTLSSLLLTLIGILILKTNFEMTWLRWLFLPPALAMLNAVVLLAVFFGIQTQMVIEVGQSEIDLSSENLKKSLINLYFQCQTDLNNRTDYLVEIYKAARFFFLSAFTTIFFLSLLSFFFVSPETTAKAIANQLETDTNFVQMVRGERGEPGLKGDKGEPGERGQPGSKGDKGDSALTNNIVVINKFYLSSSNSFNVVDVTNTETLRKYLHNSSDRRE